MSSVSDLKYSIQDYLANLLKLDKTHEYQTISEIYLRSVLYLCPVNFWCNGNNFGSGREIGTYLKSEIFMDISPGWSKIKSDQLINRRTNLSGLLFLNLLFLKKKN